MEELLTIALPAYKRTDFIRSALDSAVNQTVKCRILLIDNCSPHDEFKKIAESYNNPLITYVRNEVTVPLEENFNKCFHLCKTPWVTILHDDDMLHIQYVETAQKILKIYPDVGGFAVKARVGEIEWDGLFRKTTITKDIKILKEAFFFFSHLTPFVGVMLNRDKALELGGFVKDYYPIADFDFWFKYSKVNKMMLVNQELSFYRVSSQQISNDVIDILVKKLYKYRQNLIKTSKHRNILTYLALEDTLANNIKYYKSVYSNIPNLDSLQNSRQAKIAGVMLKYRLIKKIVNYYRRKISFENA
jgi:glycosyltransferase involved in cell wall biosynthesis